MPRGNTGITLGNVSWTLGSPTPSSRRNKVLTVRRQRQKQLASHGCQESSGHTIKVAAHIGAVGWHGEEAVYAREAVTDAAVGLNHFLGEISIEFTA
jgi:hypothetical protein